MCARIPALALLLLLPASVAAADGEPNANGEPSRHERLIVVLTNEARQDPHAWPGWDTSLASGEARPTLGALPQLFASARFHADDMAANSHFDHTSFDGTPFGQRIRRFYSGSAAAENIALYPGQDAYSVISGWMDSDGHRRNILDGSLNRLGGGYAVGGRGHYYVQNFGQSGGVIGAIPAASSRAAGNRGELVANHHNPDRRLPVTMQAAVGTECVDLALRRGPVGNQTYATMVDRPAECEPLVFVSESADGDLTKYPSTGAFLVGAGCRTEYDADQSAKACVPGSNPMKPPTIIDAEAGGCRCVASTPVNTWALLLFGLIGLRRRR